MSVLDDVRDELARLREAGLERGLRTLGSRQGPEIEVGGKTLLNVCSNDYLSLAGHPQVIVAAQEAEAKYGTGAGAARLIVGNFAPHAELEDELRTFLKEGARGPDVLLFSSGYHANLGALPTLATEGDLLVSDKLNHASLIDGARLSRADVGVFAHGDLHAVERALSRARVRRRVIVTESLFSMDGDLADLAGLYEIAKRFDAFLYVDEAHAIGVLGPEGRGACAAAGIPADDPNVIRMATLGKAFGSYGAFIAAAPEIVSLLRSRSRGFIFTTGTPPAAAAAAAEAIRVTRREPERRTGLLRRSAALRAMLAAQGWTLGTACAQIVPLLLGDAQATMDASRWLFEQGVYCQGIRPPTVSPGTCRLRVSMTAGHTDAHLTKLVRLLETVATTHAAARKTASGAG